MTRTDQPDPKQRPKFRALGRALAILAEPLEQEGEQDDAPNKLDKLLARAADPDLLDAPLDG